MGEYFLHLSVIVFLANMTATIAGFGSVIFSLTMASFFLPFSFLVPLFISISFSLNLYLVARHYRDIHRRELGTAILPWSLVGLPLGVAVAFYTSQEWLKVAFALLVVVFSLRELFQLSSQTDKWEPGHASAGWLVAGGLVQGLYGSGGPLLVYYAGRKIGTKGQFRITVATILFILNVFILGAYLVTGRYTRELVVAWASLLPVMALGIALGEWLHHRISEGYFRLAIYWLLVVAGSCSLVNHWLR